MTCEATDQVIADRSRLWLRRGRVGVSRDWARRVVARYHRRRPASERAPASLPRTGVVVAVAAALWLRLRVCDVMEHMPPEYVMLVLDRIISACRMTWFTISFVPDEFGQAIDQSLHLTVQPFTWWREHLASLAHLHDAAICAAPGCSSFHLCRSSAAAICSPRSAIHPCSRSANTATSRCGTAARAVRSSSTC